MGRIHSRPKLWIIVDGAITTEWRYDDTFVCMIIQLEKARDEILVLTSRTLSFFLKAIAHLGPPSAQKEILSSFSERFPERIREKVFWKPTRGIIGFARPAEKLTAKNAKTSSTIFVLEPRRHGSTLIIRTSSLSPAQLWCVHGVQVGAA